MSLLFDGPSYEEQLELCGRINAQRKKEQRLRPRPTTQQHSSPPTRLEPRPARPRRPYLIWSNPNPPRPPHRSSNAVMDR
jgi:hypothetical protein